MNYNKHKRAILKRNNCHTYIEFMSKEGRPCEEAMLKYGSFIVKLPEKFNNLSLQFIKKALDEELNQEPDEINYIVVVKE